MHLCQALLICQPQPRSEKRGGSPLMSHKGSFIRSKTYSSSKSFHPQCPLTQDSLLLSSKCVPRSQKTECSPLLSATFKPYVSACTSACLLNLQLGKSAVLSGVCRMVYVWYFKDHFYLTGTDSCSHIHIQNAVLHSV